MNAILWLIITVLDIYTFVIFALVILSWLIAFNVVNRSNQFVYMVERFLVGVTEPLLAPIRRFIPPLGGFDISPIILLLVIYFLRVLIVKDIAPHLI